MRWLAVAACALACTDASLYSLKSQPNLSNKMSFEGEICTDDPSAVAFPVKMLVVMDGTAEMTSADMMAQRADAVDALLSRYVGPNYRFGVVQWGAQARSPTGGFATDTSTIQIGVDTLRIGTPDAQRSYLDAIRRATTAIQDDILASTPGLRSRTRYVVLFVAHGPPSPTLRQAWCSQHTEPGSDPPRMLDPMDQTCADELARTFCPDQMPPPADCEGDLYPRLIRELRTFAIDAGAQDLTFHTFSLPGAPPGGMPQPPMDVRRMEDILTQMAIAGRGAFEPQRAGALNLLANDLQVPSSLFIRREMVVYNANAVIRASRAVPDSDGDGLSDEEERMLTHTDPLAADTDGDFVGDAIERLLAAPGLTFDPLVANTFTECMGIDPPDRDTDGDGLGDCEEVLLRTDPSLVDTDKDGIPDLVEIRRGGNPLVDDALADTDLDGLPNGAELRGGLEASTNDAASELDLGYRYRFFDEGPKTRLEATPEEPIPGVRVTGVTGAVQGPGRICFSPPGTLRFAEGGAPLGPGGMGGSGVPAPDCSGAGPSVDVLDSTASDDGSGINFALQGTSGMRGVRVRIDPMALPGDERVRVILMRNTNRTCFKFDVRNVTLVQTEEIPGGRPGPGWNQIRVFFGELPEALPRGYSVFNVATIPINFLEPDRKTPNVPFIELDQQSFVLLGGNL